MSSEFEETIEQLEDRVIHDFEHFAPFMPVVRTKAWDLAQQIKDHHLFTYLDSLRVALKSREILQFIHFLPRTGLYGGLLHDTGKIETPVEILNKTYGIGGEYTLQDHEVMKKHPQRGYDILMENGFMMSAWIALTHHRFKRKVEDSDPKAVFKNPYPAELLSYPENLSEDTRFNIMINSRVVSLADQYCAFRRPNSMHGKEPLNSEQIKKFMIDENPGQEYLVSELYKRKIFV